MSEPESFLARWARLKRESGTAAQSERSEPEDLQPAPETASPEQAAFDPASLPSIESITRGSDIQPFLQPGVPADLVRAALRAAWVADPEIRDFIGIADSQWDFNDPTAMPGFGPLEETAGVRSFVERTVAQINTASEAIARPPALPDFANTSMLPREGQVDKVWLSTSSAEETTRAIARDLPGTDVPATQPPAAVRPALNLPAHGQHNDISDAEQESTAESEQHPAKRRHGSALPKLTR
jgi:hypothetical protein